DCARVAAYIAWLQNASADQTTQGLTLLAITTAEIPRQVRSGTMERDLRFATRCGPLRLSQERRRCSLRVQVVQRCRPGLARCRLGSRSPGKRFVEQRTSHDRAGP